MTIAAEITTCGSRVFEQTAARINIAALCDRIERNRIRINELQQRVSWTGLDLTPDEDREYDEAERAIAEDRRTLADAVRTLTGVSFKRLEDVL
jgi:hypothetical protein